MPRSRGDSNTGGGNAMGASNRRTRLPESDRAAVDWWVEERAARERGFRIVAGIDEAGRGPLAGPVVAACVVLPLGIELPGVRDSKALTAEEREDAYALIRRTATAVGVGIADHGTIDALNILRATHHAMRCAVQELAEQPEICLIDGLPVQPFPTLQRAIVGGDGRCASIASASIIAKVTRDRMMRELDAVYPQYGFAAHKGYATEEHLACLERHGPCPIHRRSFAPVARLLGTDAGAPCQPTLGLEVDAGGAAGLATVHAVGESGEAVAAGYLSARGCTILAARYRTREGEVDLIARSGATLAFVEVKARRGSRGTPAEAVNARKRARMAVAAEAWLAESGLGDVECRFDVVEVLFGSDGNARVRHIPGAFMAGE